MPIVATSEEDYPKLDVLVCDGKHALWRAADAYAELSFEEGGKQIFVGAMYGFLNIVARAYRHFGGTVVVAWDDWENGPQARRRIMTSRIPPAEPEEGWNVYKFRKRKKNTFDQAEADILIKDMEFQGNRLRQEILPLFGVRQAYSPEWEADDVIAHITSSPALSGRRIGILSGDQDLLQLVSDKVTLIRPLPKTGYKIETPATIFAERGISPQQILDFKALAGDAGDNIPGIPGVGEKTALELIREHGNWASVIAWAKGNEASLSRRLCGLVQRSADAQLSAQLAALNPNCRLSWIPTAANRKQAIQALLKMKFKSLIQMDRLPSLMSMGTGSPL